jgi:serine/threonine-protein kinase
VTNPDHRLDLTGQTLMGKLQVIRLLGEGGMGAVYEVEHLITRHHRALKVMHQSYSASTETVARFIREAGVAGTLKTPHVVETYDAGQLEDGSPYVLMELLHGHTFAALVDDGPRLSPGRVVGIVCQVLEGLAVAHDAGIVHRDIKPDNVFVSEDDRGRERVRILDFGISKFADTGRNSFSGAGFDGTLTSDHTVMGTPYYMSPEQATGAKLVDERSDLYSIGVMLYEGLAGERPFDAQNMAQLVIKIHAGEYKQLREAAPHVSPELATLVEGAMHRDAAQRPASARTLLAALLPHAESNYTSSLQTLRQVPSEGPIAPMAAPLPSKPPRAVDAAARTMSATEVPTAPRTYLIPLLIACVLLIAGGVAFATGVLTPGTEVPVPAPIATVPLATVPVATDPPGTEPPIVAPEVTPDTTETAVVEPEETRSRVRVRPPRVPRGEETGGSSSSADPPRGGEGGRHGTKIIRDIY